MNHSRGIAVGELALLGFLSAWGVAACSSSSGDDDVAFEGSGNPSPSYPGTSGPSGPGSSGGSGNNLGLSPSPGIATGTAGTIAVSDADDHSSGGAGAELPVTPPLPSNPFVITAHDPLSTFAADVDTASYDLLLSSTALGQLPPTSSVRLEEFVNYFRYDYAPPADDSEEPFSISLAAAPALDPSSLMLRVGIRGRLPVAEKRAANLVFLVDTSGSMAAANKLPLVQYTLTEALSVLAPTDLISIVSYAGSTAVRLLPTPVVDAETIEAAIAGLTSAGSTDGGSGIKLAYEQAKAGYIEAGVNHVVLCTDGDFNVGLTSDDELVDLITEERKSGVTFTALGFGSNPNDGMMERVSNAGNGTYSIIYSKPQASDYVENRLLANLDYIAKDMKLQVEFNPAKVYAYRLLGYEDRDIADNDFRNDVVDAGEVGAGHRVTALYQLVLTGSELPTSSTPVEPEDGAAYSGPTEVAADDYAQVKVRYKLPNATEQDAAFEVNQSLSADGIADAWAKLDADFQWAYAVASFAEILKQSPYATAGALNTIGNIIGQPSYDGVREREDFRTAFAKAKPLLER